MTQSAGIAAAAAVGGSATLSFSPIDQPAILTNHIGFLPGAAKHCVVSGKKAIDLEIVDRALKQVVQRVRLMPVKCDFGPNMLGDFSELKIAGEYELRGAGLLSAPFSISSNPYSSALAKSANYFSKQRCGDSKTGHHSPCHLDDGRRSDNGKHLDATGGWHDACDLRKWVDATIYGMIGLSSVHDVADEIGIGRAAIVDELRWGEQYFRKLQEPAGYLMNYCGGDDGNRYTDNTIGTADDRVIHVEPTDLIAQYLFVASEAALARFTRDLDPAFSDRCLVAARKCLRWCETKGQPETAMHFASGVIAYCAMQRAAPEQRLIAAAKHAMSNLLDLQLTDSLGEAGRGAFRQSRGSDEPSREIHHGNLPPIAIAEAIELFGNDTLPAWRDALRAHANYLVNLSRRSSFGIVPFGLYLNPRTVQARPIDERVGYRYFMRTRDEYSWCGDWWVGINAHLASCGVALARAGRLLQESAFAAAAQRQLDWIVGANPFNASTISGVGRNQPPVYLTDAFKPPTPKIDGGVMNGIGGTPDDTPTLSPGVFNTCEYWTPMVGYTISLLREVQFRKS